MRSCHVRLACAALLTLAFRVGGQEPDPSPESSPTPGPESAAAPADAAPPPADAPAASPVVHVLDAEPPTVHAVDLASGTVLRSAALPHKAQVLWRSKPGGNLFVIDDGPGKMTWRFGYHPTGQSRITLLDPTLEQAPNTFETCWNMGRPVAHGELHVATCAGYRSNKPAETLPRELVVLDLAAGRVVSRLELDRNPEGVWSAGPGLALIFAPRHEPKNQKPVPAELLFVDTAAAQVAARLPFETAVSWLGLSADGRFAYLLDPGHPDSKPEKAVPGTLHVVDVAARTATRLDAGVEPRGFVRDDALGAWLFLSDARRASKAEKPQGELRALRGDQPAPALAIAAFPLFVRRDPEHGRVHVVSDRAVTEVDAAAWGVIGEVPLEKAGVGLGVVSVGPTWERVEVGVQQLALSPDGRRGFALYQNSSKLAILDLETRKAMASVTTGRGGKKFLSFMGAALAAGIAQAGSQMPYVYVPPPTGHMYLGGATALFVRPDGRYVYVLNSQTNDVTIAEVESGQVAVKIATGDRELIPLTGGDFVVAPGGSSLHVLDTRENRKAMEIALGARLVDTMLSPDGVHLVALVKGGLRVFDGRTAKALHDVKGLHEPAALLFPGAEGAGVYGLPLR
jgi:hypothetical protein